jgi:hypothetical protein
MLLKRACQDRVVGCIHPPVIKYGHCDWPSMSPLSMQVAILFMCFGRVGRAANTTQLHSY